MCQGYCRMEAAAGNAALKAFDQPMPAASDTSARTT